MEKMKPIRSDFTLWFQIKYCLAIIVSLGATNLLIYLYFSHGLGESYAEALSTLNQVEETLPSALLVTFILQCLLILFISIAINLFVSHKIAGPVFRFEHSLRCIGNGELQHVARTRDNDQLKSMVSALNRLIASLRSTYASLHAVEGELGRIISEQEKGESPDFQELQQRIAHARMQLGSSNDRRVDE